MNARIGAAGGQGSSSGSSPAVARRLSDPGAIGAIRAVAIAAALALAAAPPLLAQQFPAKAPGKIVATGTAELVAIVERVDPVSRTISLKGSRGNFVTMGVSEGVKNLPRVRVGERVAVTYTPPLALELRKGGPGGERVRAAPDERPAGAVGREVRMVADVTVVNIKNQTVTLRGPKQAVTLKLRDPALLKNITAGDQVEATYTEALALAVKPTPVAAGR